MATDSDDRGNADPLSAILTDTETFLGRWLDRFEGLLTHGERLAAWEQQLRGREQELAVAAEELNARRRRWTESHEREVEILQHQVEELTQAWLRLEDEQRGLADTMPVPSPAAATARPLESPRTPGSPRTPESPQSPDSPRPPEPEFSAGHSPSPSVSHRVLEPEASGSPSAGPAHGNDPEVSQEPSRISGGDPGIPAGGISATATPRRGQAATPAPIPVGLKSRDVTKHSMPQPAAGEESGPPRKLSQFADADESREDNRAGEATPPPNLPRESRFEQFRQLHREVGLASRPHS